MKQTESNLQGGSETISGLVDARILYRNDALFGFVDELLVDLNSGRIAYIIGRRKDGSRTSIPWCQLEYYRGNFRFRDFAR